MVVRSVASPQVIVSTGQPQVSIIQGHHNTQDIITLTSHGSGSCGLRQSSSVSAHPPSAAEARGQPAPAGDQSR